MLAADFRKNGFVCAPYCKDEALEAGLRDIQTHIDSLRESLQLSACPQTLEPSPGACLEDIRKVDPAKAELVRQAICKGAHVRPALQALGHAPTLWKMAGEVAGHRLDSAILRVRTSVRGLDEALHPWHSDVARPDGTACGRVRLAAWIPLQSVGPETGTLEIAAGRYDKPHKRGETPQGPHVRPVCPAGSVLFIDRFTPHRSLPVQAVAARFALVVWFSKAD